MADYAEGLAARGLGLELQANSTTGFDALGPDGTRYEIKGRRVTPHNASTQLSQIRGLDKAHFDYLIGVVFRFDFSVDYALMIPREVVAERARFSEHTNAHILLCKRNLLDDARVKDVTHQLSAAAEQSF